MEEIPLSEFTEIISRDIDGDREYLNNFSLYWPLDEHQVQTPHGPLLVAVQGNPEKPAILTFHDLGMNHISCFQGFFSLLDVQPLLNRFCVYHVNAPLQQYDAPTVFKRHGGFLSNFFGFSYDDKYPTLDEIATCLLSVLEYFGISHFVGFGVGAGANILVRFALSWPDYVDALYLINCDVGDTTWMESLVNKYNQWYLRVDKSNGFVEDSFINYWFGDFTQENKAQLVSFYRVLFNSLKFRNLALFSAAYSERSAIEMERPRLGQSEMSIKCPNVFVTGQFAPLVDKISLSMENMDPKMSSLLVLSDCGGMPLEEKPLKVLESFTLLLQGVGYVPYLTKQQMRSESVSFSGCKAFGFS